MNNKVYLIGELINASSEFYHTVAVCATEAAAETWIVRSGGNQMVMLDSGDIVPEYRISGFIVQEF